MQYARQYSIMNVYSSYCLPYSRDKQERMIEKPIEPPAPSASHPSLHEALAYMLEEQLATDISFRLSSHGGSDVVHAHKFILIARSPVFRAMFCGPLGSSEKEISVPDVDAQCFKEMLRFIYTEEAKVTEDNVLGLLYVSTKYMVEALADMCVSFLEDNLAEDNVCMIFELSKLYNCQDLHQTCLNFLIRRTALVLKTSGFVDLTQESLLELLRSDVLNATEVDLMKGALAWADAECHRKCLDPSPSNQRCMLGDAFFSLRLPCLPSDTLDELLSSSSGMLTESEKQELQICKSSVGETNTMFPTKKRRRSSSLKNHCEILKSSTSGLTFANKVHFLECIAPEDLTIHAVEVLDLAPTSHTIKITVNIVQEDESLCQFGARIHASRCTNRLGSVVPVHFPVPQRVAAGTFYIGVTYRFVGGMYGTVPSGIPHSEEIDCDGIMLVFPEKKACHVAGFEFTMD